MVRPRWDVMLAGGIGCYSHLFTLSAAAPATPDLAESDGDSLLLFRVPPRGLALLEARQAPVTCNSTRKIHLPERSKLFCSCFVCLLFTSLFVKHVCLSALRRD